MVQITEQDEKVPHVNTELEDLRPEFIKNYGVSMEIPALYYYDATYVPHVKGVVVTMRYHIIP